MIELSVSSMSVRERYEATTGAAAVSAAISSGYVRLDLPFGFGRISARNLPV